MFIKQKIQSVILQSTALLLFFALAFGTTAAATGLIGNPSKVTEKGENSPFDQLFAPSPGTTTPPVTTTNGVVTPPPTNEPTPPQSTDWVTNLNNTFNTGLIEGYTDDRTQISLSQRVELHNRLTASIGAATDTMTPVTYQSYSADAYMLAKRLTLEKEYTAGTEIITKYSKEYNNKDASYITVSTPYLVGRKTVQPYMGYLIISRVEVRQVAITTTTAKPEVITPVTTTTAPPSTTTTTKAPTPQTSPTPTTRPATVPVITPATTPITTPATTPVTIPVTRPTVEPEVTTAPPTTGSYTTASIPVVEPEISTGAGNSPTSSTVASTVAATQPVEEPSLASAASNGDVRYETLEVTVLSLYDRNGNLLVDDLGTKKPYYARDFSNYPIFEDENGKLYSFNGKTFKSINKGEVRSNLSYDYPAYPLGVYLNIEARYSTTTGSYKYVNASTKYTAIAADFFKAFNYAPNGIAVVVTATNNELRVINRSKTRMFAPGPQYVFYTDPQTGKKQYAKDYYYLPDTLGIESIGCAGFDSGWLRLRIRSLSMMSDSRGKVVQDIEVLVNSVGERFNIPEGYTIAGYSEGIILLEKDGLYGYYSVEGKWITQPIYTYARPFIQGLAVLGSESGTMGMIDKDGNIVLPFVYTSISDISTGVIVTYCEGIGWETYELVAKS